MRTKSKSKKKEMIKKITQYLDDINMLQDELLHYLRAEHFKDVINFYKPVKRKPKTREKRV